MSAITLPEEIADLLAGYLAENPEAVLVEDGKLIFDFTSAHYTASAERERCLLQVWSEEKNIVRRITAAEVKGGILKLTAVRFGQSKPTRLELCPQAERRSPSALKAMRATYERTLQRALLQQFPGWSVERLTSAAEPESSFGSVCTRGLLRRGQERIAVIGCGEGETQANIDNSVAVAVLWLEHCRLRLADKGHVSTLALFAPEGRAQSVQLRLSHLNREAARWRLFSLAERSEQVEELELTTELNLSTHLVHCFNRRQAMESFARSFVRMAPLCPEAEAALLSSSELSFRFHGLEFARAVLGPDAQFRLGERIFFGAAPAEYELSDETEPLLRQLIERLRQKRGGRDHTHPFYRLQPERWLQSIAERNLSLLDARLDPACYYAQLPAFAAGDRAVMDLLCVTREGRLAVVELKAAEDFQLPVQGLDYWARVCWHHRRGEIVAAGYFAGRELSPLDPLLILAAPALHVHPATDTLLRYFAPELEWKLVGLDEHWRDGIRVVFTKEREKAHGAVMAT
jgi:hypothetical protein